MRLLDPGIKNRDHLPRSGIATRPGIGSTNERNTLGKRVPVNPVLLNIDDLG